MMLYRADARTCSTRCRVRVHRAEAKAAGHIPSELRNRPRWVRWEPVARNGRTMKLPRTVTGRMASTALPSTWATYAEATASTVGDGLGFMLNGDGLAVLDLDDCLTDGKPTAAARCVLAAFPTAWVEVSPSGTGLHIWGTAPAQPGRVWTTDDGLKVEFYTRGRYMTVTGRTYRRGGLGEDLSVF